MHETPQTAEDVLALIDEHNIEFIFASFSEIRGKSNAKLVPAAHAKELLADGAGFAGFAAGEIGQGPHSPDVEVDLDPRTFRVVPWQPGLAHMTGNATVEGERWPFCPRTILQGVMDKAREHGYVFKLGFEAEFMLVDRDEDGTLRTADPLDTWDRPCYDVKGLSRKYDFFTTLSRYVTELGWDNYAVDHEDANGQFEVNVTFSDVLETADRAIFFKYMVDQVAAQHGMTATFMPKPFTDNTGNGFHYTMSLWDAETDENLFLDESDPRGLSAIGYQFAAGMLKHARGYTSMVAPTPNSYKRLLHGTDAIRTWVPVFITWGGNNRTQMLRLARPGAIEDRTPDFSGSPYLGMAAALAAGLDGVLNQLDPGPMNELNLYEVDQAQIEEQGITLLPRTLLEALHYLGKDDVLREAFGKVPVEDRYGRRTGEMEDFIDFYARLKSTEHHEVMDIVTSHEVDRYLLFP